MLPIWITPLARQDTEALGEESLTHELKADQFPVSIEETWSEDRNKFPTSTE